MQEPSFTIGVEEEYLLVDVESRDLVSEPPSALIEAFGSSLHGQFSREFLRAQVEIGTAVCESIAEVRSE